MGFDYVVFDNPSAHKVESKRDVVNVEKSGDCVKEECIIHYGGNYKGVIMKVTVVNGKREGVALILRGDSLFYRLEYVNDILNGVIELYKGGGELVVRGHLSNGEESGLFEEYVDSFLIWRGYYDGGSRYSVVRKSERRGGYYEERSVNTGELLSIAEYDKALVDKNGRCFEYEDGVLKRQCLYENGVRKEVIEESTGRDEMKWDENEERRKRRRVDDESKRLCMDSSSEFNKDSLVLYDIELECSYGVWKTNEKCYEMKQSMYENRVIEVDLKSCSMRVYDDNELKEECVRRRDCIDLDVSGRRWEGGVKNGEPFGYGIFYNEEGRKEYEGFMMDNRRICYGREYYSDVEVVKYDGCYYGGKRFGKGVLYDRSGRIEYEGLWRDDKQYKYNSTVKLSNECGDDKNVARFEKVMMREISNQIQLGSDERIQKSVERYIHKEGTEISNHTHTLAIPKGVFYSVESFILSRWLHSLKKIVIEDYCFRRVHFFVLDELSELESVEIGERSFMDSNSDPWNNCWDDLGCSDEWAGGGLYRVVDCPKLKSIKMGHESFKEYDSFELKNLPSLQSIEIGEDCFIKAIVFSLTGLYECMN